MQFVYYGCLSAGSTSLHRMRAIVRLGHTVLPVDSGEPRTGFRRRTLTQLNRVIQNLYARDMVSIGMVDPSSVNERILALTRDRRPQVVWLDKALDVRPDTLSAIRRDHPAAAIVGYSPDDMAQRFNRSFYFSATTHLYDAYFTTKSYGVSDLRSMGCPRVFFVGNGYDPDSHRPVELTEQERHAYGAPVAFIGSYEQERAQSLTRLGQAGIPVRIWGDGWGRLRGRAKGLQIEGRAVYEEEYAKVVSATKINLCFLRKANRDRQTTRSVELAACGGFMLAERTDEHADLFAEGREASFFGDDNELIDQCRHYLTHDEDRLRVARAGLARCISSGYSNDARMRDMLRHIAALPIRAGSSATGNRHVA